MRRRLLLLTLFGSFAAAHAAPPPLVIDVYNPQGQSMFPVTSEIVSGARDVVLIDAQFQRNDAEALVKKIQATGKTLTTVYISHSDPDYYFGLDVVQAAFPKAKIVATAPTVAAIKASMDGKLAYWGPVLKDNAPKKLVLPAALASDRITLEGRALEVKGLRGPSPARTHVWIPSLKTAVGGVLVSSGSHVWIADTQTPQSRKHWLTALRHVEALHPARVVPGHFVGDEPKGLDAVRFTASYLETFEAEATRAKDAASLIDAMKRAYPQFTDTGGLELSAKVVKGEMKWPQ